LKAFTDDFYFKLTGSHLQPVLDTLVYLRHETSVWFEITTLLIPGKNDSDEEISAMSQWIMKVLGPDVPLHFSAFHPDYKMPDVPATPPATHGACAGHRAEGRLTPCLYRKCASSGRRYHLLLGLPCSADCARLV
jgi:pyruvate-formate lyase-activating enzyme